MILMAKDVDVQVFKDQLSEKKLDIATEKRIKKLLGNAKTITVQQAGIIQGLIDDAIRALNDKTLLELSVSIGANPFTTTKANEALLVYQNNIERMFKYGIGFSSKTPSSVVLQLQESVKQSSMQYITKMGEDFKTRAGQIMSDGLKREMSPNEISARLQRELEITRARANTIARTETMRAAHTGSLGQARRDGKQYYIIDSRAEACKRCIKTYKGRVFSIDDLAVFPPLHPNCACIPVYFNTMEEANRWAERVSNDIDKQIRQLESEGKTINPDGTGAEVNKKPASDRVKN